MFGYNISDISKVETAAWPDSINNVIRNFARQNIAIVKVFRFNVKLVIVVKRILALQHGFV
jgi:hypothetical protein